MYHKPPPSKKLPSAAAFALALASAGLIQPCLLHAAEHYTGEAHARDGSLLYREQHWLYQDQGVDARLVLYTCADGKPFARKMVWNRPSAEAPDFVLDDGRDGFTEGVRTRNAQREVFVRADKTATARAASITSEADTVIDAGFDAFVRAHWKILVDASPLALSFVVPSRLTALQFDVRKVDHEDQAGRPAYRFRLALARWYGAFLPHIDVLYDAQTQQLLRYEGIGNIRGGGGRNLDVVILFEPGQRSENASDADVVSAAKAALDGSCKL